MRGTAPAWPAQLLRRVRPLRDAPRRLSRARREPVPGLHRRAGLSGRRRAPRPAAAGSLEDRAAPFPRGPGAGDRARCVGWGCTQRWRRRRRAATRPRRGFVIASGARSPCARSSAGSPRSRSAACRTGFATSPRYGVGYNAQAYAYALLLTDRYPNSDPDALGPAWSLPPHPVRLEVDDDGRRSRLTVAFRLLLALPHFVWLALWSVAAILAAIANWFVALMSGRSAEPLHRFLAAYVRYTVHVSAFLFLVANPFPGFAGTPGYPVDVTIAPAERQSRWITLFRTFLALPAFLLAGALAGAMLVVGFLGWFAALVTGRMPTGLRNLGAMSIRYQAQTHVYWFVLTRPLSVREPGAAAAARAAEPAEPPRRSPDQPQRGAACARRARVRSRLGGGRMVALGQRRAGRSRARRCPDHGGLAGDPRPRRPLRALLPDRVRPLAARPPRRPASSTRSTAPASRRSRLPAASAPGCCSG